MASSRRAGRASSGSRPSSRTWAQKQIEAQQAVAAAKGEADANVTLADGRAKANKLLAESLSDQILQYQYIQKLTDKITVMLLPSGNQTIFDLKSLLGQTQTGQ